MQFILAFSPGWLALALIALGVWTVRHIDPPQD